MFISSFICCFLIQIKIRYGSGIHYDYKIFFITYVAAKTLNHKYVA